MTIFTAVVNFLTPSTRRMRKGHNEMSE